MAKLKASIIKEIGAIILLMVQELIAFQMVAFMKVSGKIMRKMELEHTTITMETPIEVSFVMALSMVKELTNLQLEMFIKEIIYLI
jgi:hypothetical protein